MVTMTKSMVEVRLNNLNIEGEVIKEVGQNIYIMTNKGETFKSHKDQVEVLSLLRATENTLLNIFADYFLDGTDGIIFDGYN